MKLEDIKQANTEQYWDLVKDVVDENGWTYSKEVVYLLDSYFEHNTDKSIEFEKRYPGPYRGYRWKPLELKDK